MVRREEGVESEEMIRNQERIRFILRSEDCSRSALVYGSDTYLHLLLRTHGNERHHSRPRMIIFRPPQDS